MGNIVEKCTGCLKVNENGNCTVYADPSVRHRMCECPAKLTKVLTKEGPKKGYSKKADRPEGKLSGGVNFFWRCRNKKVKEYHRR